MNVKTRLGRLVSENINSAQFPLPEMNFKPSIAQMEDCLKRRESEKLLSVMPEKIRDIFLNVYFGKSEEFERDINFLQGWFLEHSEISRIVKEFPSSGHTFRTLYREPECEGKGIVDPFFVKGKAGAMIYERKVKVKSYLGRLIPELYHQKGSKIKIDDVASGDSRVLTELLEENPNLIPMVSIRSIDIDQTILDVLRMRLQELDQNEQTKGIMDAFELCCMTASAAPCRNADIILVVGVICGMSGDDSLKPLFLANCLGGSGAKLIVSAAQVEMGEGDPLTLLIMFIMGWFMRLKTTGYCHELVRQAGWIPDERDSFYESDDRYHIMVVADK